MYFCYFLKRGLLSGIGLLIFTACFFESMAEKVHGKVYNTHGKAIPFATIYLHKTTQGILCNQDGEYNFELPSGNHTLVIKQVGYQPFYHQVAVNHNDLELNIVLQQEVRKILNKDSLLDEKDPAYGIIKKAAKMRKQYLEEVNSYKCNAYIKSLQRIENPSKKLPVLPLITASSDTGLVYIAETYSELYFHMPHTFKENILSFKELGQNHAFQHSKATDIKTNFYNILVKLEGISERGFISPLSPNSVLYYKFQHEGVLNFDSTLVHKIKVKPIRKTDPVFTGYIYILDGSWRIHSLNLNLSRTNPAYTIDSLRIYQLFTPSKEGHWVLLSQQFEYKFRNPGGMKGTGYLAAIKTNYHLDPYEEKRFFDKEIMNIERLALGQDTNYWNRIRPIPLTAMEERAYQQNDSLKNLMGSKRYADSLDISNNQPGLKNIFWGYTYRQSYKQHYFQLEPLFKILQYNTVEGFVPNVVVTFSKVFEDRTFIKVTPSFRYGFSNERFNTKINFHYYYYPKRFSFVNLGFGRYVEQFNSEEAVTPYLSSYAMLFLRRNFLKLYEKSFVKLQHQTEMVNGILFTGSLEYANRSELWNTSLFSFFQYDGSEYTPNTPTSQALTDTHFPSHQAFIIEANLRIRFKQKYYWKENEKIILSSPFPTLTLNYQKGIRTVLGSDIDFDHINAQVDKSTCLGLMGTSNFLVSAGTFLRTNQMTFIDFKHFNGNLSFYTHYYPNDFYLLDFYLYSTNKTYYTAHYEHHFNGFIINKIPFIKRSKLQTVAGAHFLYTPESNRYLELGIGLENIFKFGRIDFFTSFQEEKMYSHGFRMGFGI